MNNKIKILSATEITKTNPIFIIFDYKAINTGRYKYEVRVEDSSLMKKLFNNYKVISYNPKDNIYIVKDN